MITKNPQFGVLTSEQRRWLDETLSSLPDDLRYNDNVRKSVYDLDGKLYVVFYRSDLSQVRYTKRYVYDVLTQEEHWGKCRKGIAECLGDKSMTVGQYRALNDAQPSFENYLNRYHEMEYLEKEDRMRYTIVVPYDD